jgi:hypothetical protein|tara:strand:+ start:463 stop:885 length:423 start_codon:yes stop_codon:yes gene_type:complete
MSAMDKLINLLETLKQENPEFHDKAGKALDALIEEDADEEIEEPEPEEEFDDSYIELEHGDFYKIAKRRDRTTNLVLKIGLLVQNFELDKSSLLNEIEKNQDDLLSFINDLKENIGCDPNSDYELVLPEDETQKAAFKKL